MKINYYLKKPLYTEKQELLKKISEILVDNHYLNIIDNVIHFKSKPKGSGRKGICLSGEIYIIKTDGLFKISWFYSEKLFISYSIGILLSIVGLYYLGDFSIPVRK